MQSVPITTRVEFESSSRRGVLDTTICDKVCQWSSFNATFNSISAISWKSVLLVEETGPEENHRPVASHWQTLSHNVTSSAPCHEWGSNSQF